MRRFAFLILMTAYVTGAFAASAAEAATRAGTEIVNIAKADYVDDKGAQQSTTSNPVSMTVVEIIDVGVTVAVDASVPTAANRNDAVMTFRVTNFGNGLEAFDLQASDRLPADQFDPSARRIVIDSDGNGRFDPLIDQEYIAGAAPLLDPDESVLVFVFADIPGALADGDRGLVRLTARAVTGHGDVGLIFVAQGTDGVDAVTGLTTAEASDTGAFRIEGDASTLVKSQSFDGDATSGTIVTYSLTARLTESGIVAPIVTDPIPDGSRFVAGSIALDGRPLTDIGDEDAGRFDGDAIVVALDPTTTLPQVVTFQTELN
ncbi:MAG: hypothetical protein WA906_05515 [Pacificimonas sp.]